jgi:hypothetical protein
MFRAIKKVRQKIVYQRKNVLKSNKCPKYGEITVPLGKIAGDFDQWQGKGLTPSVQNMF